QPRAEDACPRAGAQCLEGGHAVGVERHERRFTRCGVGPLGAFVDPPADEVDLGSVHVAFDGHLPAELRANEAEVQAARLGAAWCDHDRGTAAHRVASPIQAEPVLLLRRAVAAITALTKDGLNVAWKIHALWSASPGRTRDQTCGRCDGEHDTEWRARHSRQGYDRAGTMTTKSIVSVSDHRVRRRCSIQLSYGRVLPV